MKLKTREILLQAARSAGLMFVLIVVLLNVASRESVAGWSDLLKTGDAMLQEVTPAEDSQGETSLSTMNISQGLKEALQLGVNTAIEQLGQQDGFLGDQDVRIHLPERLQQVDRFLESMGQRQMGEQLLTSMNRAAEEAVPEVADIFAEALTQMSLTDAQAILQGQDDAATAYFKEHTSELLQQRVTPHVKQAMDKVQVSYYYNMLIGAVQKYDSLGLMHQYLGQASDLEVYVTEKTLAGLFVKIAEQEKMIRDDPAARSTEILRQVFGSRN